LCEIETNRPTGNRDTATVTLCLNKTGSDGMRGHWSYSKKRCSDEAGRKLLNGRRTTYRQVKHNIQGGPKKRGHSTFSQISRKLFLEACIC